MGETLGIQFEDLKEAGRTRSIGSQGVLMFTGPLEGLVSTIHHVTMV